MANHSQQSGHETARLAAYFLATLPAAESEAVEAELYANPDLAATAFAIEDELVNDYARGALSTTERRAFEQNYLVTDERRARLATARALLAELAATQQSNAPVVITAAPIPWWRQWFTPLRLSYAAIVLLCAALGWWWNQRAQTPRPPVLVTTLSPTPTASPALTPTLSSTPTPTSTPTLSPSPTPAPVLAALTLVSSGTRSGGAGQSPPTVTLTPVTTAVALKLIVRDAAFPRYQAVLQDQAGRSVWRAARLTTNTRAEGLPAIALQIPADRLGKGEYVLLLTAQAVGGGGVTVGEYPFRVAL